MKRLKPLHISVLCALELVAMGGLSDNMKLRIANRLEHEGEKYQRLVKSLRWQVESKERMKNGRG